MADKVTTVARSTLGKIGVLDPADMARVSLAVIVFPDLLKNDGTYE